MKTIMLVSIFALSILISVVVLAQSSAGDFVLVKSTTDNGGGISTTAEYTLTGTIGQHDASRNSSGVGDFSLAGGFWARAYGIIFRNGFEG